MSSTEAARLEPADEKRACPQTRRRSRRVAAVKRAREDKGGGEQHPQTPQYCRKIALAAEVHLVANTKVVRQAA